MNTKNAGHVKIALLARGMRIGEGALEGIGEKWQEKIYSYSLTDWTDRKIILPSDIKLDQRVFVGFRLNPNSDWELTKNGGGLKIRNMDGQEMPTEMIPRPKYYDLKASTGDKLQSIGVSCGNHGISFFINSYCEYFQKNENCRFCGLVPTQKRFSDSVKRKTTQQVRETMKAILELECPIDFIQLSGGSSYDHDKEVRSYIPFILLIKEELVKRGLEGKIPIHLTSMPPKNLEILSELKEAGLNTISFDLECPTEIFFQKYCPGKERSYGYRNMRNALLRAQQVFGGNNVYSILIMGIEPRNSFISGIESLLENGVVPTLNIYHHDPFCSSEMDVREPDTEELIDTAGIVADLFRKYHAIPGNLGCAHYDIGHEITKGYF